MPAPAGGAAMHPFDRALLHDALGRLRRRGERRQAVEHLRAAYDHFASSVPCRAVPRSRCR